MVPSAPIALELCTSARGVAPSDGKFSGSEVSKRRRTVAWRGPAWGLRPVCWASCWYIGLPAAAGAAALGRVATGEGAAATAGDGDGLAGSCGFAAGAAEATLAGATEAAGALAGGNVGPDTGAVVGGAVAAWHAASSPVELTTTRALAPSRKRRRVKCIGSLVLKSQRRPPASRAGKKISRPQLEVRRRNSHDANGTATTRMPTLQATDSQP